MSSASPSPVSAGQVIAGKFRVERVLGVGGMGVVVAAHHLLLGRTVALKFLIKGATRSDEAAARFMREGRALALIRPFRARPPAVAQRTLAPRTAEAR